MLLTHLGYSIPFITWAMNCLVVESFFVLVNGEASIFFRPKQCLRQGCTLYQLLLFIVVEGLTKSLLEAKRTRGIQIGLLL